MKFYFVEFTHKETLNTFCKFGITRKSDVLERFNTKYDMRYSEFNIKPIFSLVCSSEEAETLEKHFLGLYPKNFRLETLLNKPFNYYNNFSGITETFIVDTQEKNKITKLLYSLKVQFNGKII